jgi:tetratricopeptide (TPR) repeat protein
LQAGSDYHAALTAHANFYTALISSRGPLLHGAAIADGGSAQLAAVLDLQVDLENILQSLHHALAVGDVSMLEQLCCYLFRFLTIKGEAVALEAHYRQLLAAVGKLEAGSSMLGLWVHSGLAAGLIQLGRFEEARPLVENARALAVELGHAGAAAAALRNAGLIEHGLGNYDAAREFHQRALEASQTAADTYGRSAALSNIGLAEYGLGAYAAAGEMLAESRGLWR